MKTASWDEAITIARNFSDHYAMLEEQQEEVYKITADLPENSVIVELGVANGKTAAVLAYVAKYNNCKYYGVDNFGLTGNEQEVRSKMAQASLPYEFLVGDTRTMAWDKPIDFILIDAGHDEENVREDCNHWIPFIKSGGYVAFHDYDEPFDPASPHTAVRLNADRMTGDWKEIGWYKGLKIRQKP